MGLKQALLIGRWAIAFMQYDDMQAFVLAFRHVAQTSKAVRPNGADTYSDPLPRIWARLRLSHVERTPSRDSTSGQTAIQPAAATRGSTRNFGGGGRSANPEMPRITGNRLFGPDRWRTEGLLEIDGLLSTCRVHRLVQRPKSQKQLLIVILAREYLNAIL